ncbi:MAG: AAA family ATPase [Pseudomonadota bacterium]
MPTIDRWLTDLGLAKYVPVFEEAEIDVEILPELTEEDLKELNLPLGPRRKILAALKAREATAEARHPAEASTLVPGAQAERRHLTIMFVDLVGSTQLALRLDAEELREVITKYQDTVARVVRGFNGYVATLMGDGVLCYFGWPHAREGDAEQAVRAGLAALAAMQNIPTPDGTPLAARAGVATGVVVVGDLVGKGTRQEALVVGETPNLAARLQAVAQPNQLVIPGETRALLGSRFEMQSLGLQDLKGVDTPVEAFVVARELEVESRFDAKQLGAIAPIVGREPELAQITKQWLAALDGRGGMVLLEGEAGIGKSRLVRAAIDTAAPDDHIRLTFQCSAYHCESAFYPFIQQMSLAAGLTAKDSDEVRLNKLEAILTVSPKAQSLIASLFGLDGSGRFGTHDISPGQQREELMQAMAQYLVSKAAEKPVLMVIEDLYWIDPTSLELLEAVLRQVSDKSILMLATSRMPLDQRFDRNAAFRSLPLNRLGEETIFAIVDRIAGGKALPPPILKIIAQRTDGVPLFVEELTRTLMESGALKETETEFVLDGTLGDVAIPNTLQDSLTARLDSLGPVKEVAQIAACVGREFDHRLLPQICEIPETKLEAALQRLVVVDLLHRRGTPPKARYFFKHALVRDAAYDTLLKDRRRPVHQRILRVLETEPGIMPELLAAHAEAAGLIERAIDLWSAACRAALDRPAYQEGEAHVRRALALNKPRLSRGDRGAKECDLALHVQLSLALIPAKGVWSDEVIAVLERALTLADEVGDTPVKGDILYNLLLGTYFRGSLEVSVARADELKEIAKTTGDLAQLLVANRLAAIARLNIGRFAEAQPHLDEAEALCDAVADQDLAARFGHDPVAIVKVYQALNASFRGQSTRAAAYLSAGTERAEKIGHVNTTCILRALAVVSAQIAQDRVAEREHLAVLSEVSAEHNVAASRMGAEAMSGLLQLAEGQISGLDLYLTAEQKIMNANIRLLVPGHRTLAARRLWDMGQGAEALQMADEAEALMDETGERSWWPELMRLRAAIALPDGKTSAAETALCAAIGRARRDGATPWHLRAAIDLAHLYKTTGRDQEAYSVLAEAHQALEPGASPTEAANLQAMMARLEKAKVS